MEKAKSKSSLIVGILICILLLAIAGLLIYMIVINYNINDTDKVVEEQTNQSKIKEEVINKEPSINETLFTFMNKTYGELKEKFGGIKESSVKGYQGAKTVLYNNGYTGFYQRTFEDNESFKDNEKIIGLTVKLEDIFLNYNDDVIKNENLKKIFNEGFEEIPYGPNEYAGGGGKVLYYKGYTIMVSPYTIVDQTNEKNIKAAEKEYDRNSSCQIKKTD